MKFISDPDSNSILVQNATPAQLVKIEALIEYYDQPQSKDAKSVRSMQIFHLRYAKAENVAEAVKDIYRDLLSPTDKALIRSQQQRQNPRESYSFVYDSGDGESVEQKAPRYKGLLSIGVDDVSNTLVVSAPAHLLEEIGTVIEELDELAKPATDAVFVLQLKPGISAPEVQRQLSTILGGSGAGRQGPQSRRQPTAQPDGNARPPTTQSPEVMLKSR